ncbi:MAG: inorganic diphosphatase [Candidatus Lightella neohaematopini]|nr:inorganic diphosphatase [Candidatus Lightella neohaematopini]
MNFNKLQISNSFPEETYVIIEISYNSNPIKYEINKNNNLIFVDRFIPSPVFYPCNYGYINNTLSLDGDPIDALVITPYPLNIGTVILCRPLGLLKTIDESGKDVKLIMVPSNKICNDYNNIIDIDDISKSLKSKITYFFENYKKLESKKWTKIYGWGNKEEAKKEMKKALNRVKYKDNS